MREAGRYDAFAWVYNRHWIGFARGVLPVLERLILEGLPPGACILDLCCGTGQLATLLTERGYRVVGMDISPSMLAFAQGNAPEATFLAVDARHFRLLPVFDAVVSTFDSLNHMLSPEDLGGVFANVHRCLREGGRFLFDLNMAPGFEARWRGSFAIVEEDYVVAARSRYDAEARRGEFDLTIFRDEGGWHRHDLQLVQRCYEEGEVRALLAAANLETVGVFDAVEDLGLQGQVGRAFFLARKPKGQGAAS